MYLVLTLQIETGRHWIRLSWYPPALLRGGKAGERSAVERIGLPRSLVPTARPDRRLFAPARRPNSN